MSRMNGSTFNSAQSSSSVDGSSEVMAQSETIERSNSTASGDSAMIIDDEGDPNLREAINYYTNWIANIPNEQRAISLTKEIERLESENSLLKQTLRVVLDSDLKSSGHNTIAQSAEPRPVASNPPVATSAQPKAQEPPVATNTQSMPEEPLAQTVNQPANPKPTTPVPHPDLVVEELVITDESTTPAKPNDAKDASLESQAKDARVKSSPKKTAKGPSSVTSTSSSERATRPSLKRRQDITCTWGTCRKTFKTSAGFMDHCNKEHASDIKNSNASSSKVKAEPEAVKETYKRFKSVVDTRPVYPPEFIPKNFDPKTNKCTIDGKVIQLKECSVIIDEETSFTGQIALELSATESCFGINVSKWHLPSSKPKD